jgi:hypothetical protein
VADLLQLIHQFPCVHSIPLTILTKIRLGPKTPAGAAIE